MLADHRLRGSARLLAGAGLAVTTLAHGQSIEPRAYSPAPVGVNFLVLAYAESRGGLAFDSSVPLTNPQLHVWGPILAYARTFDLLGKLAKFDVILPYSR